MYNEESLAIYKAILENMSEGVIVIGFDKKINYISASASTILGISQSGFIHMSFAEIFYSDDRNDDFNQLVLDAVYDSTRKHSGMVNYYVGDEEKPLYVTTDYFREAERSALIVVISDMSEICSLESENEKINSMFSRYLSKDIAKTLLESPDGLEMGGKKHDVTVMMTDLRGFTVISDSMPPADVISMLNNYLGEMVRILTRYGGTVIEFMGDAILAVFGAPCELEAPEASAVACAIEMQNHMKNVNEYNRCNGFPEIEMGIGINTGIVVLGNIGSEECTKYSVIGSHVNLCSRIESYTIGGQILVSSYTREKISSPLGTRGEVNILPKGVKIPVLVYDVSSIGEPFNVSCTDDDTTRLVEVPIDITFNMYAIKAKHVSEEQLIGKLVKISEKRAIVSVHEKTASRIREYNDYKITAANHQGIITFSDIFAKVIGKEGNLIFLHFTASNEKMYRFVEEIKA